MKEEYNSNSVVAIKIFKLKRSERFKKLKTGNIFSRNRVNEWHYNPKYSIEWDNVKVSKIPECYIFKNDEWFIKPVVQVFLNNGQSVYHYCNNISECMDKAQEIKDICGNKFIKIDQKT